MEKKARWQRVGSLTQFFPVPRGLSLRPEVWSPNSPTRKTATVEETQASPLGRRKGGRHLPPSIPAL